MLRHLALFLLAALASPAAQDLRFVILGDRTGEAQQGVYEQIWREVAAERPAFAVSVGDSIQGGDGEAAESEWKQFRRLLTAYRNIPLYLAPGNHDVWSDSSARLFANYAQRPLSYGFDAGPAHFTILDNSRSDQLPAEQLAFLESDLAAHADRPFKFVVSHRPSWILDAFLGDRQSAFHRLMKKYRVRAVVAGHIHQLLHTELEGIDYISVASSGAHLRASGKYGDGWFFGHILATVRGGAVAFEVRETGPPHGQGRISRLAEWGRTGRLPREPAASP